MSRAGRRPTDANKNNERNEYIPSFIAKKPFYIDDATASQDDYLKHQRLQSEKNHDTLSSSQWYDRGKTLGPKATKYRKGACENCGSMSHQAKDCLQRKRKVGAKWTGRDIAADEAVQEVKLGWDAKRDRWNGFEAGEYAEVVEEYNALDAMKRKAGGGDDEGTVAEEKDGAKYEEETDMGRQQASSTRNLRLREDTAKYLLNLDLDSARYDPKTRSMLDTETSSNALIAEDGFQRASGDAAEFERAQKYAWETQERGDKDKIHLQANPTEAQLLRKRKAEEDLRKQEERKKALTDRYGAQDGVLKKRHAVGAGEVTSNERYVEYDERGRIKGAPEKKEQSMYAEDVLVNNHTSVWGSWWKDFKWGYDCCHSVVKNSFCTGEDGRRAAEEAEKFAKGLTLPSTEGNAETTESDEHARDEVTGEEGQADEHGADEKGRALKPSEEDKRRRREEMKAGIGEEEMERYRMERVQKNDPMAGRLGIDELMES